jgi:DNA-binding transcriptional LysR family regulator
MVAKELGVAVVPLSDADYRGSTVTCLPFGDPPLTRTVVRLERQDRRGGRLAAALAQTAIGSAEAQSAPEAVGARA